MNAPKFRMVVSALLVAVVVASAHAKLPAPPPVDPAKAAEAKVKAAEAAKKETDQLSKAQDRAVERYKKEKGIKTAATAPAAKKK
jgi:hypothetical protein